MSGFLIDSDWFTSPEGRMFVIKHQANGLGVMLAFKQLISQAAATDYLVDINTATTLLAYELRYNSDELKTILKTLIEIKVIEKIGEKYTDSAVRNDKKSYEEKCRNLSRNKLGKSKDSSNLINFPSPPEKSIENQLKINCSSNENQLISNSMRIENQFTCKSKSESKCKSIDPGPERPPSKPPIDLITSKTILFEQVELDDLQLDNAKKRYLEAGLKASDVEIGARVLADYYAKYPAKYSPGEKVFRDLVSFGITETMKFKSQQARFQQSQGTGPPKNSVEEECRLAILEASRKEVAELEAKRRKDNGTKRS